MSLRLPYLRDGVDVYVRGTEYVHFVFLASRKRIVVRATAPLIQSLSWMDGSRTLDELEAHFGLRFGASAVGRFLAFLSYLQEKGIVIERNWLKESGLGSDVARTQERQLEFLLDLLDSPQEVIATQRRISSSHVVVFGAGGVGSWLVRLLLAMGFRSLSIVDHDVVEQSDVTRHAFFDRDAGYAGSNKSELLARQIESEYPGVHVRAKPTPLSVRIPLDELVGPDADLVVNAADEPYIGYTSVLLSRFCIPRGIPLFVAGGFDAHLASLGELIVPGATPCADCYSDYFKVSLADWSPFPHPVEDRRKSYGGLCSLSVFSASAAALGILRLFTGQLSSFSGQRSELLFDSYELESFDVPKDPKCPYCRQACSLSTRS